MKPEHERLNRYIDELQAGRHPGLGQPHDAEEAALFEQAAAWSAMREGADEPDPAFIADLRAQLAATLQPHGDKKQQPPANLAPVPINSARLQAVPTARRRWLPSRRQIISTAAAAVAGLVAGFGFDHLKLGDQTTVEAFAEPAGNMNPQQGKWFAIARADQMKIGEVRQFNAGAVKGFVLRRDDGFIALSGVCTHLGCDIKWLQEKTIFGCSCHGSSFDLSGRPLTGPAIYKEPIRPLTSFNLKIEADVVYVWA